MIIYDCIVIYCIVGKTRLWWFNIATWWDLGHGMILKPSRQPRCDIELWKSQGNPQEEAQHFRSAMEKYRVCGWCSSIAPLSSICHSPLTCDILRFSPWPRVSPRQSCLCWNALCASGWVVPSSFSADRSLGIPKFTAHGVCLSTMGM